MLYKNILMALSILSARAEKRARQPCAEPDISPMTREGACFPDEKCCIKLHAAVPFGMCMEECIENVHILPGASGTNDGSPCKEDDAKFPNKLCANGCKVGEFRVAERPEYCNEFPTQTTVVQQAPQKEAKDQFGHETGTTEGSHPAPGPQKDLLSNLDQQAKGIGAGLSQKQMDIIAALQKEIKSLKDKIFSINKILQSHQKHMEALDKKVQQGQTSGQQNGST